MVKGDCLGSEAGTGACGDGVAMANEDRQGENVENEPKIDEEFSTSQNELYV